MIRALAPVLGTWAVLMLLFGAELVASFLHLGRFGPAAMAGCGAVMAVVVAFAFMHLRHTSSLAQAFALAALFWLAVLLGLGTMDPLTRRDYPVPITRTP